MLLMVFFASITLAFYFEESYRSLVRMLFKWFTNNKIIFFGKNFHFFANARFVISFGIAVSFFTFLLKQRSFKKRAIEILKAVILFFLTTFIVCYVDSNLKIIECTACDAGTRRLNYNQINYDLFFVLSMVICVLPVVFSKIKQSNATKNPGVF